MSAQSATSLTFEYDQLFDKSPWNHASLYHEHFSCLTDDIGDSDLETCDLDDDCYTEIESLGEVLRGSGFGSGFGSGIGLGSGLGGGLGGELGGESGSSLANGIRELGIRDSGSRESTFGLFGKSSMREFRLRDSTGDVNNFSIMDTASTGFKAGMRPFSNPDWLHATWDLHTPSREGPMQDESVSSSLSRRSSVDLSPIEIDLLDDLSL